MISTHAVNSTWQARLDLPVELVGRRRGTAVVEFAVCLPLLMLIVLGAMEATHAIFLKQALSAAAYEGMRVAIEPGGKQADAVRQAESILNARLVKGSTIVFDRNVDVTPRGQKVAVQVSAPISSNSPFIGRVIADRIVTVRTVMVKE
jgi:Flp pilus assembly protein TadG